MVSVLVDETRFAGSGLVSCCIGGYFPDLPPTPKPIGPSFVLHHREPDAPSPEPLRLRVDFDARRRIPLPMLQYLAKKYDCSVQEIFGFGHGGGTTSDRARVEAYEALIELGWPLKSVAGAFGRRPDNIRNTIRRKGRLG